jgi:hypothetical protein
LLVKYFHNNTISLYIVLAIVSLVLWASTYFFAVPISLHKSPLLSTINQWFRFPIISGVVAFILVICTAFFINLVCQREEAVDDKLNKLPGLLYVIGLFSVSSFSHLHEVICINLALIIALSVLWSTYRKEEQFSKAYNISLLFGVITLFYLPGAIYLIGLIICVAIIKPLQIKEIIISVFGFITPLYFKEGLFFIVNKSSKNWLASFHFENVKTFSFANLRLADAGIHAFLFFGITLLLSAWLFITFQTGIKVKTLKVRNTLLCLLLMHFIFSGIVLNQLEVMLGLCILPLSILAGDLISSLKNLKAANALLLILFINAFLYLLHLYGFLIYN